MSREHWPAFKVKKLAFFGSSKLCKICPIQSIAIIIFGIRITRNWTILHDKTTLFDFQSISTMVAYVQHCFETWTGWFSHNAHHLGREILRCLDEIVEVLRQGDKQIIWLLLRLPTLKHCTFTPKNQLNPLLKCSSPNYSQMYVLLFY